MATERQELAVEKIIENRGSGGTLKKAMLDAGYEPNTAHNPKNLTESKGFKEVCEKYGLTDSLIIGSLVEDIKAKPQNRKPELELGAKIKGMLVDKTDITSGGNVIPIYGGLSKIQGHSGNEEDLPNEEEN